MRKLKYIILLFSVCLFSGCTEEIVDSSPVEKELTLTMSTVPLASSDGHSKSVSGQVDEGTADDYVISDFWIFQYNENDVLIGKPTYYRTSGVSSQSVAVLLPPDDGTAKIYKAVFLANTHDNSLALKIDHSTLAALAASGLTASSSSDLYQQGYDDMLMNGVVMLSSETQNIECQLYRNVAKVKINVNNIENSGITITSVQLKNVNNKLFYADRIFDGKENFPNSSDVSFVDFERDDVNVAPGNPITSLTYYVTRNMRGSVAPQSGGTIGEYDKNGIAPTYSTYIEVMARHNERNTPVRYRFYLGKNNSDNFDVEPNYLYDVSLTFNDMGSSEDNRVEDLSEVLLAEANSYIIQPMQGVGVKYTVPIKNRINTFWQSKQGMDSNRYGDYIIDDTKQWVAEVIWQDVAGKQVIKFCQDDGSLTDVYQGGAGGDSFSFVSTDDAVGIPCNVLIGVRSADSEWDQLNDGYMWSWHIWLTAYNPDTEVGGWTEGKYSYQVPGGHLHRYGNFSNIAMYAGKFIMDRNLGASRAESYNGITQQDLREIVGMYYEYGRKDPFPPVQIYDIKGVKKTFSTGSNTVDAYGISVQQGPAAMYASVIKPYNYYYRLSTSSGNYDWVVDNTLVNYDWNDLNKMASAGNVKSFFDPCPPGWKLPHHRVFDELGSETVVYASNCVSWTDVSLNTGFGLYKGWLTYLSGEEGWKNKIGETAFFPAGNNRNHASGELSSSLGGNGGLWMADAVNNGNACYLYLSNSIDSNGLLFSHPRKYYRYIGMPIRCIQE